uniref:Uncharacterized protein LOC104211004 n=1 Tax=Nicotiana sylvestris TaxID=4096 RepID=A0A1U7V904_NICSY|nr:PREDICTED: uncharacterized protein LOC104211004 [Nicotiana sylvestris]
MSNPRVRSSEEGITPPLNLGEIAHKFVGRMRQAVEGLKELIVKGSVLVPANITAPPERVVRASKKRKRVVSANEPDCSVCKKRHLGRCWMTLEIRYSCGKRGTRRINALGWIMDKGVAQLSSSATTSSITPSGRGAVGGGIQNSGGPNKFYAMMGFQGSKSFSGMVTGMLTFQSRDEYALIDSGSALSYVNPYIAMGFGIESGQPYGPFCVSTL